MSQISRPQSAHIVVPVDAITAARAEAAGYSMEYTRNRIYALLTLECEPTDPVVAVVSDHVSPMIMGNEIRLDLSEGLRQVTDDSPPIPSDVPGPDRAPLWTEPKAEQRFSGAVHLPASADVADLPKAVLDWLRSVSDIDETRLAELRTRWRAQAQRMLDHAKEMVESLPASLTEDERQGVLNRLRALATQVRHARDGGLDPDCPDFEDDPWGGQLLRPAHSYINEAYQAVLLACERTLNAGGDRVRSDDIHGELSSLAFYCSDRLPKRFAKANQLGLLDTTLGAARGELVDVVWPGWRYLGEGEELRAVVNPSLEALEVLEAERAIDATSRRWPHDPISLSWLVPAKKSVLVSSFLGRDIIRDEGGAR